MATPSSIFATGKITRLVAHLFSCFLIFGQLVAPAGAEAVKVGDLVIAQLWARATPAGAKVGAAYLTIENNGSSSDRLISVWAPTARAEIHEMTTVDGIMSMRPVEGGLAIAPGQKIALAPGGLHLMLMDLKGALKDGEKLNLVLQFELAGRIDAEFQIRPVGASALVDQHESLGHERGAPSEGYSGTKM